MGSLKSKNGYQEVQEDFMLAAIDIVADPSAPNAFVNGIMEGREWMFVQGSWQEREHSAAKKLISESWYIVSPNTKTHCVSDCISLL
jgi:hypothetical protein